MFTLTNRGELDAISKWRLVAGVGWGWWWWIQACNGLLLKALHLSIVSVVARVARGEKAGWTTSECEGPYYARPGLPQKRLEEDLG